jgi:hypothetical protein
MWGMRVLRVGLVAAIVAPALLLSAAQKPPPVEAVETLEELAASCVHLGVVASVETSGAMTRYQMAEAAEKIGGDTIVPHVIYLSQGDAGTTLADAKVFRCGDGPWLGGALPPLALPQLALAHRVRLDKRKPQTCGSEVVKAPGSLVPGEGLAAVARTLKEQGVEIKRLPQGAALEVWGLPKKTAALLPQDDPRGRRWMVIKSLPSGLLWPEEDTALFLGFSGKQELLTVAWLFREDKKKGSALFREFTAQQLRTLDSRHSRVGASGGLEGMALWSGPAAGAVVAMVVSSDPPLLLLTTSVDPLEATTLQAGSCGGR